MERNMVIVFLLLIILTLLVPVTARYYEFEQAFTPNNLVHVNLVSR